MHNKIIKIDIVKDLNPNDLKAIIDLYETSNVTDKKEFNKYLKHIPSLKLTKVETIALIKYILNNEEYEFGILIYKKLRNKRMFYKIFNNELTQYSNNHFKFLKVLIENKQFEYQLFEEYYCVKLINNLNNSPNSRSSIEAFYQLSKKILYLAIDSNEVNLIFSIFMKIFHITNIKINAKLNEMLIKTNKRLIEWSLINHKDPQLIINNVFKLTFYLVPNVIISFSELKLNLLSKISPRCSVNFLNLVANNIEISNEKFSLATDLPFKDKSIKHIVATLKIMYKENIIFFIRKIDKKNPSIIEKEFILELISQAQNADDLSVITSYISNTPTQTINNLIKYSLLVKDAPKNFNFLRDLVEIYKNLSFAKKKLKELSGFNSLLLLCVKHSEERSLLGHVLDYFESFISLNFFKYLTKSNKVDVVNKVFRALYPSNYELNKVEQVLKTYDKLFSKLNVNTNCNLYIKWLKHDSHGIIKFLLANKTYKSHIYNFLPYLSQAIYNNNYKYKESVRQEITLKIFTFIVFENFPFEHSYSKILKLYTNWTLSGTDLAKIFYDPPNPCEQFYSVISPIIKSLYRFFSVKITRNHTLYKYLSIECPDSTAYIGNYLSNSIMYDIYSKNFHIFYTEIQNLSNTLLISSPNCLQSDDFNILNYERRLKFETLICQTIVGIIK